MNFINLHHVNINYNFIKGAGKRIFLLINPLGTDYRIWNYTIPYLLNYGSVLCFDKQGHGLSSKSSESNYPIVKYSQDVIALLDFLKIEKTILIGSSIGGIIGQYLGVFHADRIDKLILCNSAPKVGTFEGWENRINHVKSKGIVSFSNDIMNAWFSEKFNSTHFEIITGINTMLINSNEDGYITACKALQANDLTDIIKKINIPTLCIAGSEDGSTPPSLVESMACLIPNAEYHLIEGVGHLPFVEQPSLFTDVILIFLAKYDDNLILTP